MKKISVWFWLLLKRQLKSVFFLILLISVPVITLIISNMPSMQEESANYVALFCRDDDAMAHATVEELMTKDSCYTFVISQSEEELTKQVLDGSVECGFIFDVGITEKTRAGKYKKNVIQVKKEGAFLANSIFEIVFQAYFRQVSETILLEYAAGNEAFAHVPEEGIAILKGTYEEYMTSDSIFKVNFEMLGDANDFSETVEIEAKPATFPLRSIMAILIMVGGMLGLVTWLSDREKGVFIPMRQEFVFASRVIYPLIPALLLGISTVISVVAAGVNEDLTKEVVAMGLYLLLLAIVGAACSMLFRSSISVIGMLPIMVLVCLVICPVFIDLANNLPAIKYVRFVLPPYYYKSFF